MRIGVCAAAVLVVTLAACGQEGGSPTDVDAAAPGNALTGPPPLTLERPEGEVDLPAYAWCLHDEGVSSCADGAPPAQLPQTSAADLLVFAFPLEGWTFTASFRRGRPDGCERAIQVDAVDQGDGTFVVPALGPAGRWEVQISGYADDGGSLATAFDWTTPVDSATPPDARGEVGFLGPPSVYADDEVIEAYGPSLTLTGLAEEPGNATAELVLADAGARATYPLSVSGEDACPRDGTIALAGDHQNKPVALPDLGEPPYSYKVSLTLDGKDHVGTGQWPDDLHPATSNQLALTWAPPLPTWTGSP